MTQSLYESIMALAYKYQYGDSQWHGFNRPRSIDWWDGRTSDVKKLKAAGITKLQAESMLHKRTYRRNLFRQDRIELSHEQRINFLKETNACAFDMQAASSRYNRTGIDWRAFHRPTSNGWVILAPDEPANNWHTTDAFLVRFLSKKFLKN